MVKQFNELELLLKFPYEKSSNQTLVDVGGHVGSFAKRFAKKGWRIIAFEPEPENRRELENNLREFQNVTIIPKAVSNKEGQLVPFYVSSEHWGIHSLKPFHKTHQPKFTVETVRLDQTLKNLDVNEVSLLKVDVEGADFLVLQSFDFNKIKPEIVMCEFADDRSQPNFGCNHHDIAKYMQSWGYHVFVSEWSPVKEYGRKGKKGTAHNFLQLVPYPLNHESIGWGNLIFVRSDCLEPFNQTLPKYLDIFYKERQRTILEKSKAKIEAFQNKHQGERCVIIGNDPSLNKMDLCFLKDEICFATNKTYLGFDKWNFTPNYYVAVNPLVIDRGANEIQKIPCQKFISNRGVNYIAPEEDVIFVKTFSDEGTPFSNNPVLGLNEGGTVTYVAMQLAYYMGFKTVILIGVDHKYIPNGFPNTEAVSTEDDIKHFHPHYFGKGTKWNLPDLATSEKHYQIAKNYFNNNGREIIDATLNGCCNVFPKVDYKALFFENTKLGTALGDTPSGFEQTTDLSYTTLVRQAWFSYKAGYYSEMEKFLNLSLNSSPCLQIETIFNWVEKFTDFSREYGDNFDVDSLTGLLEWKRLICKIIDEEPGKAPNLNIGFYPDFESGEAYADHFYRMLWYLNPIVNSIDKIFIPTKFLVDKLPQIPDYLDPNSAKFYTYFKNKLIFLDSADEKSLVKHLQKTNIVLLWKTSDSERDKIPQTPFKKEIKNKKIWRIDHSKERFAGSFYLYCGEQNVPEYSEYLEKSKSLFDELAEKITSKNGFLFGTGPSLSQMAHNFNFSDGETIACNSMVKNKTLMEYLHPRIIVIADPIFHAGCSTYAAKFRKYLCEALSYFQSYLIVPMRDLHIYKKNLDGDFQNRIIGIPFQKSEKPNLNLKNQFNVTTANNILTLFLLPVAATFFDKIYVLGCDGRPLEENTYFWQHDKSSQINDEMDTIQKAHPGFFSIDYNDYYLEHCNTLEKWILAAENLGKQVTNLTPSYIPALKKRTEENVLQLCSKLESVSEISESPLVSVIVPARNAANTIVTTIESVQKEKLDNWELIVINDGSTDETASLVSKISVADGRVHLYETLGEGVSIARNIGLNVAKGKYIGFLDADDLFTNDALTKRVHFLEKNKDCSGVYCQTKVVDANLNEFGWVIGSHGRKLTFLDMHGNIHLDSVIGKAELMKRQSFEIGRTNGEDWLYLSQVLRAGVELEYVSDTHVLYLIHPTSAVLTKFALHEEKCLEVIDIIYGYDEKCVEPSSKYRDGLQKPNKKLVILRRRLNQLTFLLLTKNSRQFFDCMQRSVDLPWSNLSKKEICNNIKRLVMRNYCCASQELWQKELISKADYIRKVFSRFKVNESLPHYYQAILELCQ